MPDFFNFFDRERSKLTAYFKDALTCTGTDSVMLAE